MTVANFINLMIPAEPKHGLGETMHYTDHHGRQQSGRVLAIEAHWGNDDPEPLLIYTVEHPTYRNRRMHVGIDPAKEQAP